MTSENGQESRAARYYDHFAEVYEDERHQGYHALIDELESELVVRRGAGQRCLELGCGTGLILQRVAEVASEAKGIDLSEGMLDKARARGLDVRQGSVDDLPYDDASFDLVYSFKVLAHVPDIRKTLREAARVTRPGGRLLLEFYNPLSLRYLARRAVGSRAIGTRFKEHDVFTRWDTPWQIKGFLPDELAWVDTHGVRVWTPVAAAHRVPVVGKGLATLERLSVHSPARWFGGFLVVELERR